MTESAALPGMYGSPLQQHACCLAYPAQIRLATFRLNFIFSKFLDAFRIECPLQGQPFFFHRFQSVVIVDIKGPLADDGAGVLTIIDEMNCAPPHLAPMAKGIPITRQCRETREAMPDECS